MTTSPVSQGNNWILAKPYNQNGQVLVPLLAGCIKIQSVLDSNGDTVDAVGIYLGSSSGPDLVLVGEFEGTFEEWAALYNPPSP